MTFDLDRVFYEGRDIYRLKISIKTRLFSFLAYTLLT